MSKRFTGSTCCYYNRLNAVFKMYKKFISRRANVQVNPIKILIEEAFSGFISVFMNYCNPIMEVWLT